MKTFEAKLTELVQRVAPAELRIRHLITSPKLLELLPSLKGSKHFSVSFQTRSFDEGASSGSIREAVEMALDSLENGPKDIDPVVPSWYALSRMQREVVEHVLQRHVAKHKERGATKSLAQDQDARHEYEMADAFEAALACLEFEFEYENEPGTVWEPLHARGDAVRKPTDPVEPPVESRKAAAARRQKLSETVKELSVKNRSTAKKARRVGKASRNK
jgi:hypothetical protein